MKLLLTLSLLGLSSMALSCTDFSGTYLDEKDSSQVQIIQTGCESISSIDRLNTLVMIIDGEYHQVLSQEVTSDNGTVLGKVVISERGNFGTRELFLDIKSHVELADGSLVDDQETKAVATLNSEGDMESVNTQADGKVERSVLKRIK
jgi:hypothetical protein